PAAADVPRLHGIHVRRAVRRGPQARDPGVLCPQGRGVRWRAAHHGASSRDAQPVCGAAQGRDAGCRGVPPAPRDSCGERALAARGFRRRPDKDYDARRMRTQLVVVSLALLIGAPACQKSNKDKPSAGSNQGSEQGSGASAGSGAKAAVSATGSGSAAPGELSKDIDSKDILTRTETAPEVYVKHVLLGWKELAAGRPGGDPRAAKRSNAEAAALAQEIAAKLKANPDSIDALVKENSEDPGSLGGEPYNVKGDTPFVPEFKTLALRLKEKEVGIVKTAFGYHVMERVAPPPPDPLESNDILQRKPEAGPGKGQHVLHGWKDPPAAKSGRGDPKAMKRDKAEADKLAKDVLDKARAKGADMAKLMKEYSEDPGSKDSARAYDVSADAPLVETFKDLALRLKENEV